MGKTNIHSIWDLWVLYKTYRNQYYGLEFELYTNIMQHNL